MIIIVVTSKPADGLLHYSYEYCSRLNLMNIEAQVLIVCNSKFTKEDYIQAISRKYIHCENIIFNEYIPDEDDITIVMGRSMITLSWINFKDYSSIQQRTLKEVFRNRIISVYSENHPIQYPLALEFYKPRRVIDLCDTEVYPNGVGSHFEKTIDFSIYNTHVDAVEFKYLFLGTNADYYKTIESVIDQFPDHGILTYDEKYINPKNNNILVPVKNLMSLFETYVYTKNTFDPAPRIFQECKYYGKEVIYLRDKSIVDGGMVYWNREIKEPDMTPLINAIGEFNNDI